MNRFPLKVALRYLVSKKSHTAVSVISAISVCAVAVTALAMICVLSVFNGFSGIVNDKLSLIDPDIRIMAAKGKVVANADSMLAVVRSVEGVELATPTITENALAVYADNQVPVVLKGVTEDYDKLTDIASTVKGDGSFLLSADGRPLSVLSVGAAVALQAHPGFYRNLELYAPKRLGTVNVANPLSSFRFRSTFVSGVFEVGQAEYDTNLIFVPLDVARELYSYDKQATAIEIKMAAGYSESRLMSQLGERLGKDYVVENRLMQHSESLKMINVEKWITFLLLAFILIIASFNIISSLAILIIEKNESIATLRSLGADSHTITRIFVIQGWLISLSGALAGIVLGVILCLIQQHFGLIKMSADAHSLIIDTYPVIVEGTDVLSVLVAVAVVGFLTSLATAVAMRKYLRR